MEDMLEEVSFTAPEQDGAKIVIDETYVQDKLAPFVKDTDLSDYIL